MSVQVGRFSTVNFEFDIMVVFNHLGRGSMVAFFADDVFQHISLNENVEIWIKISLKFVPNGPMEYKPTLF